MENILNRAKDMHNILSAAENLLQEDPLTIKMKSYIQELIEKEATAPGEVEKDAIEALKRTGVLTEDGKRKERIVS